MWLKCRWRKLIIVLVSVSSAVDVLDGDTRKSLFSLVKTESVCVDEVRGPYTPFLGRTRNTSYFVRFLQKGLSPLEYRRIIILLPKWDIFTNHHRRINKSPSIMTLIPGHCNVLEQIWSCIIFLGQKLTKNNLSRLFVKRNLRVRTHMSQRERERLDVENTEKYVHFIKLPVLVVRLCTKEVEWVGIEVVRCRQNRL